jgi:periplasmic divalent cation tolerance protein
LKPVVVLTTVGADFDAKSFARVLVESRLAACVNILPAVESIYRWEGKVIEDGETLLLIKTVDQHLDALQELLFTHHPYQVPEFLVLEPRDEPGVWREWLLDSVR